MGMVGEFIKSDFITVDVGTSVMEAATLMKIRKIDNVLVFRQGSIAGIVTESDIVKKAVGLDQNPHMIPVEAIMSPVVEIEAWRPLMEAAELMNEHRSRHLTVNRGGTVVGVLSLQDLLQAACVALEV